METARIGHAVAWPRKKVEPFTEAVEAIEGMLNMGFLGAFCTTLDDPAWIEGLGYDMRECRAITMRLELVEHRLERLSLVERT